MSDLFRTFFCLYGTVRVLTNPSKNYQHSGCSFGAHYEGYITDTSPHIYKFPDQLRVHYVLPPEFSGQPPLIFYLSGVDKEDTYALLDDVRGADIIAR